ncbi:MAG: hypothetical protein KatS3mg102_1265 [Planctomycetota bacterium]|nr:MAG: hypothetical protein KatS3mg102_1265 [Planctomycetota bacterium]
MGSEAGVRVLCGSGMAPAARGRWRAPGRRWGAVVVLGLCALAALCRPAAAQGPSAAGGEEVYLTLPQALGEVFPEAVRFEQAELRPSAEERARIEQRLGRRLYEPAVVVHRAWDAEQQLLGWAVVTEEIGKYRPITFIVAVDPAGRVKDVAVMVYRESIGAGVRRRRFLAQFIGKDLGAPLELHRDVINLSGATLSSRAVTRGIKKVLVIVEELVRGDRARVDLRWRPVELGAAGSAVPGAVRAGPRRQPALASGPVRRARWRMGTWLEIACWAEPARARLAMAAAFAEVARLEAALSHWRPDSELSALNRSAGQQRPLLLSPDTYTCLELAVAVARTSGGAFDPTLVPGGWQQLELEPRRRAARLGRPELELDLGGIGKGYALDRAAAVLQACGVRRAVLDFGGQLLVMGPPPGPLGWLVAVRDPRAPADRVLGVWWLAGGSVASSGSYERGAHIVDPRRGQPARGVETASVWASSAALADALATAAVVAGPEGCPALLERWPQARAVLLAAGADTVQELGGGPGAGALFLPLPRAAVRGAAGEAVP